ncbi:F-box domain-containing protein [Colletotrichum asianum]|uniref:F-box domain-containing protein n=1 Tax=Colletotrichum asianum TaxID=702518 RepID=A0A8H3W8J7_9PEZI|nr:F-box domain-containing protein [Colletotrichum asianum]
MTSPIIHYLTTADGELPELLGFECDDTRITATSETPPMRLPVEILHQVYLYLHPCDFNSARHTCRSWFTLSLNRSILVQMLKRGGWWSSVEDILGLGLFSQRIQYLDEIWTMSKWLSRECTLCCQCSSEQPAFVEVGQTLFSDCRDGTGAYKLSTSVCGRFLMASHNRTLDIYELDHRCEPCRSRWAQSALADGSRPRGLPRPVARILCPANIIACAMDASLGRQTVGLLIEEQVDEPTGQDLARRFPLSTESDFLYFLPPSSEASGVDTSLWLRLISSATAVGPATHPIYDAFARFKNFDETAVVYSLKTTAGGPRTSITGIHTVTEQLADSFTSTTPRQSPGARERNLQSWSGSAESWVNTHAVPLSDGSHVLFTDPRSGTLCLGADAPRGSTAQFQLKAQFRPPVGATSSAPTVYAASTDLRHGVRVVAVFPTTHTTEESSQEAEKQLVVCYTIPPDVFRDISFYGTLEDLDGAVAQWRWWWPKPSILSFVAAHNTAHPTASSHDSLSFPIDVPSQHVDVCSDIIALAVDSGPDMLIWAFSAEGLGRCWALNTGRQPRTTRASTQADGSLREIDCDGDILMPDVDDDA